MKLIFIYKRNFMPLLRAIWSDNSGPKN